MPILLHIDNGKYSRLQLFLLLAISFNKLRLLLHYEDTKFQYNIETALISESYVFAFQQTEVISINVNNIVLFQKESSRL